MSGNIPSQRRLAEAERADQEAFAEARLKAARPRPAGRRRSGTIRAVALAGTVLLLVSALAHVVLADPLARLAIDAERGRAEYCRAY